MSTKTPRLWLFDFDNTIAKLEQCVDWAASRRELEPMLREAGAPAKLFEQFPKRNLPLYDAYLHHLRDGANTLDAGSRAKLERASAIIENFELLGVDRAEPLEGAVELLNELKVRRLKVGIVTSNSSATVQRWLEPRGITVDVVVGRDSLLSLKPAPDSIVAALESASALPSETVYVGDVEGDFSAAKAAGVAFYAMAASTEARDRFVALGAAQIFSSPAALQIEIVQTIRK